MRRDICVVCGLPIFLAEKLVIVHNSYHRVCFRCARCDNQLTPRNYYETEEGQFCCETCPDEEEPKLSRIENIDSQSHECLSDEEKFDQQYENVLSNYQSTLSPIIESAQENSQLRLNFISNELLQDRNVDDPTQLGSTFSDDDAKEILSNVPRRLDCSNNSNKDINIDEDDDVNRRMERNDSHGIDYNSIDKFCSISNRALNTKESTDFIDEKKEEDSNTADGTVIFNTVDCAPNKKFNTSRNEDYPEEFNPFDEEHFNASSTNPFDSDDDEEEPSDDQVISINANKPSTKRRLLAPKINLNPFGSDEENSCDNFVENIGTDREKKPVPKPRSVGYVSICTFSVIVRKEILRFVLNPQFRVSFHIDRKSS